MTTLLERVKAATGPDSDEELYGDILDTVIGVDAPDAAKWYGAGRTILESVDAILELIERELPGWGYSFQRPRVGWERKPGVHGFATIGGGEPLVAFHSDGATPALALCAAFLAAKEQ